MKKQKTRIFFTSDLWLDRVNSIQIYDRKVEDVEQMNELLIERWNTTVGNNDIVFILGNFMYNPFTYRSTIDELNGVKVLMVTNMDKYIIKSEKNMLEYIISDDINQLNEAFGSIEEDIKNPYLIDLAYANCGLATPEQIYNIISTKVSQQQDFIILRDPILELPNYGIIISTNPLLDWSGKDEGVINIHGGRVNHDIANNRINARVDLWDYSPVEMNSIKTIIKQITQKHS